MLCLHKLFFVLFTFFFFNDLSLNLVTFHMLVFDLSLAAFKGFYLNGLWIWIKWILKVYVLKSLKYNQKSFVLQCTFISNMYKESVLNYNNPA